MSDVERRRSLREDPQSLVREHMERQAEDDRRGIVRGRRATDELITTILGTDVEEITRKLEQLNELESLHERMSRFLEEVGELRTLIKAVQGVAERDRLALQGQIDSALDATNACVKRVNFLTFDKESPLVQQGAALTALIKAFNDSEDDRARFEERLLARAKKAAWAAAASLFAALFAAAKALKIL